MRLFLFLVTVAILFATAFWLTKTPSGSASHIWAIIACMAASCLVLGVVDYWARIPR